MGEKKHCGFSDLIPNVPKCILHVTAITIFFIYSDKQLVIMLDPFTYPSERALWQAMNIFITAVTNGGSSNYFCFLAFVVYLVIWYSAFLHWSL